MVRYYYVIEYKIRGRWQADGEWYPTQTTAEAQADSNAASGWGYRIRKVPRAGEIVSRALVSAEHRRP